MAFDAVKVVRLYRAFYEELGRKFMVWADEAVEQSWAEISSEHDDVCLHGLDVHSCLLINS